MLAVAAFAEAERLAPAYSNTHWDSGRQLIKVGRREQAFAELRVATVNRPDLFIKLVSMAWEAYGGNCPAIEQAVGARDNRQRLILAHFFIRNSRHAEALNLARKIDNLSKDDREMRIRQSLAMVGAEKLAERPMWELSGGQKQRVFLARALAGNPEIAHRRFVHRDRKK